ncbi:hypothetical protein BCR36DRAFT_416057 [Piromyces finnis]|uniref:Uncharacterized protein n=1 Tax=Piromyces finnis TaxID=1754191 RepID=A0A1Y1UX16_9FUNG|nr:hypothetical protein BCR36DRAFT_416057 [Piromyces finnis]|eukprot:ORX42571.1 hypothetical protein BCR36DRAFT_416057 [Piromyces finnis]
MYRKFVKGIFGSNGLNNIHNLNNINTYFLLGSNNGQNTNNFLEFQIHNGLGNSQSILNLTNNYYCNYCNQSLINSSPVTSFNSSINLGTSLPITNNNGSTDLESLSQILSSILSDCEDQSKGNTLPDKSTNSCHGNRKRPLEGNYKHNQKESKKIKNDCSSSVTIHIKNCDKNEIEYFDNKTVEHTIYYKENSVKNNLITLRICLEDRNNKLKTITYIKVETFNKDNQQINNSTTYKEENGEYQIKLLTNSGGKKYHNLKFYNENKEQFELKFILRTTKEVGRNIKNNNYEKIIEQLQLREIFKDNDKGIVQYITTYVKGGKNFLEFLKH